MIIYSGTRGTSLLGFMLRSLILPETIRMSISDPALIVKCSNFPVFCHFRSQLLLAGDVTGIMFKLADFGRASRAGEDRDGEDLGDGRYLPRLNDPSPPARAATGRDLYALGITLYHSVSLP